MNSSSRGTHVVVVIGTGLEGDGEEEHVDDEEVKRKWVVRARARA